MLCLSTFMIHLWLFFYSTADKNPPVSTIRYVHSVFFQFHLHLKCVYLWVAAGLPAWDTGSEVEKQQEQCNLLNFCHKPNLRCVISSPDFNNMIMFSILTHGLKVKKKDVSFYKMFHLHHADCHSHIFTRLESPSLPAQYHQVLQLS